MSYFSYSAAAVHSMEKTEPGDMTSTEDILAKEIESWKGFEYALREENRILFNKMLSECIKSTYGGCVSAKGGNFVSDALFLILIQEQQKKIKELMVKLRNLNLHRS
jgi:hypothetical protein